MVFQKFQPTYYDVFRGEKKVLLDSLKAFKVISRTQEIKRIEEQTK